MMQMLMNGMRALSDPEAITKTRTMLERNQEKWKITWKLCETQTSFRVSFVDTNYGLSIQHSSMVTSGSYAETALLNTITDDLRYDDELGYDDVRRHLNVEELESHIDKLNTQIRQKALEKEAETEE